jgi:dihydrodipicolinate reductase
VTVQPQLPGAGAADVWIDFSAPASTVANVQAARAAGARMVIGTTGLPPPTAGDRRRRRQPSRWCWRPTPRWG